MLSKLFGTSRNRTYQDPSLNTNLDEFEVNKWVLSQFVVEKVIPITGYTPYPLDELILMAGTVCRFKPTHIFEWGTHIGKSARIFYETIKQFNIAAEIHSFDLPDDVDHIEHPHDQRGVLVKGLDKVHLYQEDGLVKSFELFEKSDVPGKRALFYVDGDHAYETVHLELSTILSRNADAVVLLHDTFFQSEESNYNVGPYKAVQEVLRQVNSGFKKVETTMGLPGMTLIYT